MSDFPDDSALVPTPTHIHTWSRESAVNDFHGVVGAISPASISPTANRAIYIPIVIRVPYLVQRAFWVNGTTLTSSNADFGIYTADGTRLYSTGSTAQSGASAVQYVTVATPFVLTPGRYYFAWVSSNTTNRGWGMSSGNLIAYRSCGFLQQATALPLPATMTAAAMAGTLAPFCGVTRTASGY